MTGTIRQGLTLIGQRVAFSLPIILTLALTIASAAKTAGSSEVPSSDGTQVADTAAATQGSPDEVLKAELEALMSAAHDAQTAEVEHKAAQPSISAYQQKQVFYAAREQARLEKLQKERQQAEQSAKAAQGAQAPQSEDATSNGGAAENLPPPQAQLMARVAQPLPLPQPSPTLVRTPGPLARINIAFHVDDPTKSTSHVTDNWVSQISGARDGEFTVLAKAEGRDADGRVVNINADWVAADPASVAVSPGPGQAMRITVRRTGASNLTVTASGLSKDIAISAAPDELHALRVDILQ